MERSKTALSCQRARTCVSSDGRSGGPAGSGRNGVGWAAWVFGISGAPSSVVRRRDEAFRPRGTTLLGPPSCTGPLSHAGRVYHGPEVVPGPFLPAARG